MSYFTSTTANVTQWPAYGPVPVHHEYRDPAVATEPEVAGAPSYTAADGVHPLTRPARAILPPARARVAARRGRWHPVPARARRTGATWLVRVVALLAALVTLTGCAASLSRSADGSYTLSVDGREQRLVVAGDAAAVAADARPLDQIALARSGGDARAAHEALLAAVDAVWALLAQLHAVAQVAAVGQPGAVAADQAAVLRNAAAAQREATPR